jgi:hypothetical protein
VTPGSRTSVSNGEKPKWKIRMPAIHPVTSWQNRMIQTCGHPDCTDVFQDRMLIRFALQITPRADVRRLMRAFDKLTKRHDTLRTRFVEVDGEWKAAIDDNHPFGLQVQDIGNVDDGTFEATLNRIAAKPISVFAQSLIEMHLLRFGKRGDAVVMRVHHAITDGFGIVVMVDELIKLLLSVPILKPAVTHAQYLANWDDAESKPEMTNAEFWENKVLPIIPPLNFGRRAKGLAPLENNFKLESTIGLQIPADNKALAKLTKRATQNRITLYNYLFAAFADVICDQSGSDEVYVATAIGRYDHQLDTYVGHHSKLVILKYKRDAEWAMDKKATEIAEEIRDAIGHIPTTAFDREGKIHQALSQSGTALILYFVNITQAFARAKRSKFSTGFLAGDKDIIRVGPWGIRRVALWPQAHTVSELQIDLGEDNNGPLIALGADAEAFSTGDLEGFGKALMTKLDLD